jgi:hypothetical protein
MEAGITDSARSAMVRAAVANLDRTELRTGLDLTADPRFQAPKAIANALNALRKHRDPVGVVTKPQYRAALPYVAAAAADACLARTIELLGDHSEDPTREQLLDALGQVEGSFSEATIAVMLATVADDDMPASDLCFEIAAADPKYGLSQLSEAEPDRPEERAVVAARPGVTPEQREARRRKKQRDADERRKKMEAARKAGEQLRRERKKERSTPVSGPVPGDRSPVVGTVPRVTRRATLTPLQEEEFDRLDPLVGSVVFAWVPFDAGSDEPSGLEGKSRRCVVVAGSPSHLLVRPGYSEGGTKSRDWKSVPVRHWKKAGFDRPTWIDVEALRVERDPAQVPVGRLAPDDWNSLW